MWPTRYRIDAVVHAFPTLVSPVPLANLTQGWILERLSRAALPAVDEDFVLYRHPPDKVPIPAAVLVPLINQPHGVTVMLTQRTPHLHDHAGQISFPGGRVDPGDVDRVATALREAEEETGLPQASVAIIGSLPEFDIQTGFRVTPVVGWIEPPLALAPDPFEVAEVFEVPLAFLLDPANHRRHSDEIKGRRRNYYSIPYENRNIWGATAGMLHALYRTLK
jgi:8-oxo-dGTP pyrophosphatase MutT (NUDIX family)